MPGRHRRRGRRIPCGRVREPALLPDAPAAEPGAVRTAVMREDVHVEPRMSEMCVLDLSFHCTWLQGTVPGVPGEQNPLQRGEAGRAVVCGLQTVTLGPAHVTTAGTARSMTAGTASPRAHLTERRNGRGQDAALRVEGVGGRRGKEAETEGDGRRRTAPSAAPSQTRDAAAQRTLSLPGCALGIRVGHVSHSPPGGQLGGWLLLPGSGNLSIWPLGTGVLAALNAVSPTASGLAGPLRCRPRMPGRPGPWAVARERLQGGGRAAACPVLRSPGAPGPSRHQAPAPTWPQHHVWNQSTLEPSGDPEISGGKSALS